jgi:hypothetical protein
MGVARKRNGRGKIVFDEFAELLDAHQFRFDAEFRQLLLDRRIRERLFGRGRWNFAPCRARRPCSS